MAEGRGAIDLKPALYLGIGAGAKGLVAGLLDRFVPQLGISPEIAGLLLGYIVAERTAEGSIPNLLAKGVFIGSIAQLVKEPIERWGSGLIAPRGGSSHSSGGTAIKDIDEYIKVKYGV